MSSKLPVISAKKVIKALGKIGYKIVRQRGSHIRLRNNVSSNAKPITVPNHKTLKSGLLIKIIKDTGIDIDEFIELLKK